MSANLASRNQNAFLGLCLGLCMTQAASAVDISDDPLIAATRSDPNLMFLLDNSGAMGDAAQEVADTEANRYLPSHAYITQCPAENRLPPAWVAPEDATPSPHIFYSYDPGLGFPGFQYDANLLEEIKYTPVWTDVPDGFEDILRHRRQLPRDGSARGRAGDLAALYNEMRGNPDPNERLKIMLTFKEMGDPTAVVMGPYTLYDTDTNPRGRCFYDEEFHGGEDGVNSWYEFSYYLDGTQPAGSEIISTGSAALGNYLNWFFDASTSTDSTGTPWNGTHPFKPGLKTRFSVVQEAFSVVVDDLTAEGLDLRLGLTSIVSVPKAEPQGARIVEGLKELTAGHAGALRDGAARITVEPDTPGGLYQALYDVGGYFAEGFPGARLVLHPDDPAMTETLPVEEVFPSTRGTIERDVALRGGNTTQNDRTYPEYADASDKPTASSPAVIASCQQNFALLMTAGDRAESLEEVDSLTKAPLTTYYRDELSVDPDTLDPRSDQPWGASDRLANVARALSEVDLRPDLADARNTISTYIVGFKDRTWNSRDIGEMLPVAEATGGRAYTISDFDGLVASINSAITDIVSRSAVATGATVSSRRLSTGTKAFRVEFNSGVWTGDVKAFEIDASGSTSGDIDTTAGNELWSASAELGDLLGRGGGHRQRRVVTHNGSQGVPFRYGRLTSDQRADLEAGGDAALGRSRLAYLRGSSSGEGTETGDFRVREAPLGDIVGSTPVYVGEPSKAPHVGRRGALYVGANDGMFHGFFSDTGEPIFSFIPAALSAPELVARGGGLHRLTNQEYGDNHRYFVDLSPVATEVPFTSGGNTAFKTVVIGGLGAGGKGLFAIDASDPGAFSSESGAAANVLWERYSTHYSSSCRTSTAGFDDLGYVLGEPVVAPLNTDAYGVIFSGGYNGCAAGSTALFIVDATDGSVIEKLYVSSDSLSPPAVVDLNGDGTADRAYAGDLEGRMWAFDLSADTASTWSVAFNGQPLFTASSNRPITAAPAVVRHPSHGGASPNMFVLFGTGQYLAQTDITDTSTQAFYGVWDRGQGDLQESHLLEQEFEEVADPSGGSRMLRRFRGSSRVDWANQFGWFVPLVEAGGSPAGERVVTKPTPIGMNLFFNTLIPNADLCGSGGTGWLMAINLEHGGNPEEPAFDLDGDGHIDEANDTVAHGQDRVSPAGESYDAAVPWKSNFLVSEEGIQETVDSDGNFDDKVIATINTAGRMSWRELFDE